MTTENLKALETKAKNKMMLVAYHERHLQVSAEEAVQAIKNYHEALLNERDVDTNLCIHDGCPEIGDYEMADGNYECKSHHMMRCRAALVQYDREHKEAK